MKILRKFRKRWESCLWSSTTLTFSSQTSRHRKAHVPPERNYCLKRWAEDPSPPPSKKKKKSAIDAIQAPVMVNDKPQKKMTKKITEISEATNENNNMDTDKWKTVWSKGRVTPKLPAEVSETKITANTDASNWPSSQWKSASHSEAKVSWGPPTVSATIIPKAERRVTVDRWQEFWTTTTNSAQRQQMVQQAKLWPDIIPPLIDTHEIWLLPAVFFQTEKITDPQHLYLLCIAQRHGRIRHIWLRSFDRIRIGADWHPRKSAKTGGRRGSFLQSFSWSSSWGPIADKKVTQGPAIQSAFLDMMEKILASKEQDEREGPQRWQGLNTSFKDER